MILTSELHHKVELMITDMRVCNLRARSWSWLTNKTVPWWRSHGISRYEPNPRSTARGFDTSAPISHAELVRLASRELPRQVVFVRSYSTTDVSDGLDEDVEHENVDRD